MGLDRVAGRTVSSPAIARSASQGRLREHSREHDGVGPMRQAPPPPASPALLQHLHQRNKHREDRVADQITRFAGSMRFVYIHAIWFGLWIGLRVEHYPFGLLTMIVSLEAIFLSTFVMISQNRADEKRQVIADEQWRTVQQEERQNEALLHLSSEILALTKEMHAARDTAVPRDRTRAGEGLPR